MIQQYASSAQRAACWCVSLPYSLDGFGNNNRNITIQIDCNFIKHKFSKEGKFPIEQIKNDVQNHCFSKAVRTCYY